MGIVNTLSFIIFHPLSKHRKFSAILRYIRWQVGSRIVSGPIAVRFVNDTRLLVERGMIGAMDNVHCGLDEFEDIAFLFHFLRQGDFFVDVGANVGSYTVLASAVIGARSLAFEPVPDTYNILLDNIHINRIEIQVDAKLLAVGDSNGEIEMTSDWVKSEMPKLIKIDAPPFRVLETDI